MNIYLQHKDCAATLTTWIYCAFWQHYAAHHIGAKAYIHWPNQPQRFLTPYHDAAQFSRQPNMFDWYFVQPDFPNEVPAMDELWLWGEEQPAMNQAPLMSMPLATIRAWYHLHLRFSPAVEARGRALQDKYGIDFAKTIGVTWRGTDIYLDGRPYLPIEVYFPFIDQILEQQPDCRIACTAEEEGVLDKLLARYPMAFRVEEFLSAPAGGKHNPERHSPVSGFERGMQPALMVWLFSKCAHYIKNRSSTGAVASWLSDGNIVCLAHPENLGYEPASPILHPKTGVQLWP